MAKAQIPIETNSRAVQRGQALMQRARKYARASKSANTIRAYRGAMQDFTRFCQEQSVSPLPASPETVIMYLAFIEQQSISTIQQKLAAIAEAHRMAHLPDPTVDEDVRTVMDGLRRTLGSAPHKKTPLLREDLASVIGSLPNDLRGKRDRALLLVGFAGAFRESELVALRVEDIEFSRTGLIVTVRKSKTDQTGQGLAKVIPVLQNKTLCPVTALKVWLREAKITRGPLFRKVDQWNHVHKTALTPQSVALVVKKAAQLAGLDPKKFAGHSLRSGFVTTAYAASVPEWSIQKQTGHRSITTLRSYNQDEGAGAEEAARAAMGE